jgi:hypothetical protein
LMRLGMVKSTTSSAVAKPRIRMNPCCSMAQRS